jgi:cell shape-determining protein MreC
MSWPCNLKSKFRLLNIIMFVLVTSIFSFHTSQSVFYIPSTESAKMFVSQAYHMANNLISIFSSD